MSPYKVGDIITLDGVDYEVVAVATSNEEKVRLINELPPGSFDLILHVSDTEKYFLKVVQNVQQTQ